MIELEREHERRYMQDTIEDLRRRLDQEAEERRRLTMLLTHSEAPAAQSEQHKHNGDDNNRLLRKLFGRRF